MESKLVISCFNIKCPERFSLCCHGICTNGEKGEPHFVCIKCRKEFKSPKCQLEGKLGKFSKEDVDNLMKLIKEVNEQK